MVAGTDWQNLIKNLFLQKNQLGNRMRNCSEKLSSKLSLNINMNGTTMQTLALSVYRASVELNQIQNLRVGNFFSIILKAWIECVNVQKKRVWIPRTITHEIYYEKSLFFGNTNGKDGFEVQRVRLGRIIVSKNHQRYVLFSRVLANWVSIAIINMHWLSIGC